MKRSIYCKAIVIYEVLSFQIEHQFLDCRLYWKWLLGNWALFLSYCLSFRVGIRGRGNRATRISILVGIVPINNMKIQGYKKAVLNPVTAFAPRQYPGSVTQSTTGLLLQALHYCMVATYTWDVVYALGRLPCLSVTLYLSCMACLFVPKLIFPTIYCSIMRDISSCERPCPSTVLAASMGYWDVFQPPTCPSYLSLCELAGLEHQKPFYLNDSWSC